MRASCGTRWRARGDHSSRATQRQPLRALRAVASMGQGGNPPFQFCPTPLMGFAPIMAVACQWGNCLSRLLLLTHQSHYAD